MRLSGSGETEAAWQEPQLIVGSRIGAPPNFSVRMLLPYCMILMDTNAAVGASLPLNNNRDHCSVPVAMALALTFQIDWYE